MMRLEYDKEVDAAYIYLDESKKEVKPTKTSEINENMMIDLDIHGKIIGIEILNASKMLNKKTLLHAIPA